MTCVAFEGTRKIASGPLQDVALAAKPLVDDLDRAPVLIFDAESSQIVDVDFRGDREDVARRLSEPPRGPGRPKLGVVGREVTLLPRHWDWLNAQPGGASVALRKLVEEARRANESKDRIRQAQESTYRFIHAMAGNEPGFEEATRALFAGHMERFTTHAAGWPDDVRDHALHLAAGAWA
jgi:uncharacterized protein